MKHSKTFKQVSGRIDLHCIDWLEAHFKTKANAVELLIPWCVDVLNSEISVLKSKFTKEHLSLVVCAYKDVHDEGREWNISFLKDHLFAYVKGASKGDLNICSAFDVLDNLQVAALIVWAMSYWAGQHYNGKTPLEYAEAGFFAGEHYV